MIRKSSNPLLDEAFKWLSFYVRLEETNDEGWGEDYTTGEAVHFNDADAGHFIPRENHATAFTRMNVHLQSRENNRYKYGDIEKYRNAMIYHYGEEAVEKLERKGMRAQKLDDCALRDIIAYYKKKSLNLVKRKMFKLPNDLLIYG